MLEASGVVECSGDTVSLTPDYLDALNRERLISGEIEAERRDRERYEDEREKHHVKLLAGRGYSAERIAEETGLSVERVLQILSPPNAHPANVRADGEIAELEPEGGAAA
jgi:hypothetical protein